MRLGRDKGSGRHRGNSDSPAEREASTEYDSYLSALGADRKESERFGTAQVYQLRLPADAARQLHALAEHRQTAPLALIQEFVIDGLRRAR